MVAKHRKMFLWYLHQLKRKTNDDDHEASDQVTTEPRRLTRISTAPKRRGDPVLEILLLDNDEPTNYEEAMVGPDSNKWLGAMKSEKGSMYETKYRLW